MERRFAWCIALAAILCAARAVNAQDWTQKFPAHSPAKRMYPAMAQFSNQSVVGSRIDVVMFGGLNLGPTDFFRSFNVLGDTWIWDDTDWTPLTISNSPPPRFGASMAYFPGKEDGTGGYLVPPMTVLFGGKDAAGNVLSDTWVFRARSSCTFNFNFSTRCGRTFSWTQVSVGSGPSARFLANMAFSSIGYQFAFNGNYGEGIILTGGTDGTTSFNDTWRFDANALSWSNDVSIVDAYSPARSSAALATCSGLDGALLFGGTTSSGALLSDSWHHLLYPIDSSPRWVEVNAASEPSSRFGHGMAFYPVSERQVMYGGQGINAFLHIGTLPTDTWNANCNSGSFGVDTTTWTGASPAHNPGKKSFHGMTTGPNGLSVVIFGGNNLAFPQLSGGLTPNGRDSNETWTWGRRAACLPAAGSELAVGSTVNCRFDAAEGMALSGWTLQRFAPHAGTDLTPTFHTEAPGTASITVYWTEPDGPHSQTFTYSIVRPNRK